MVFPIFKTHISTLKLISVLSLPLRKYSTECILQETYFSLIIHGFFHTYWIISITLCKKKKTQLASSNIDVVSISYSSAVFWSKYKYYLNIGLIFKLLEQIAITITETLTLHWQYANSVAILAMK